MYDTFRDSNEQTINMANQYLDVSNSFIEAEALKYAFQSDLGKYMIGLYETDAVQRKTVINSVGSSILRLRQEMTLSVYTYCDRRRCPDVIHKGRRNSDGYLQRL